MVLDWLDLKVGEMMGDEDIIKEKDIRKAEKQHKKLSAIVEKERTALEEYNKNRTTLLEELKEENIGNWARARS